MHIPVHKQETILTMFFSTNSFQLLYIHVSASIVLRIAWRVLQQWNVGLYVATTSIGDARYYTGHGIYFAFL